LINFRFHLISLIAVFLALAVGVVMGYGVLGQPTVDTLQSRINNVEARANRIKAGNDELRAENKRLSESMTAVGEFAVTSRLENKAMVPVAVRGVDESEVARPSSSRARAGRPFPVWSGSRSGASTTPRRRRARAHRRHAVDVALVRARAAAKALASRLSSPPTTGTRSDLLAQLADAKFLSPQAVEDEQRRSETSGSTRPPSTAGRDPSADGRHRREGRGGAARCRSRRLWSS
jgi:hypothetical protein